MWSLRPGLWPVSMPVHEALSALMSLFILKKCKDQEWTRRANLKDRSFVDPTPAFLTLSMNFHDAAISHTSQLYA